MAKSRRKLRQEARLKKDQKKFVRVTVIAVIVLLVLLYVMFQNT